MGYIDEILNEETYFNKVKGSNFKILKFILNNNDGIHIQCNIYDENISKLSTHIKLNEVIAYLYFEILILKNINHIYIIF